MDIPSSTGNKHTPLFLSIDKSWKGNGYTFSFHPDKNDEASMTVKGLYARLAYVHGEKIHKYFTPPAIEAGVRMTWDPLTKKVSSEEDREVNDLLGLDDDMTFKIPPITETEADISKRKIVFRAEKTDDSVLTFTEGSKRPLPGEIVVQTKKKRKSTEDMDTDESASATSSKASSRASDNSSLSFSTRKTIDSRISTIESGLSQCIQLMNQVLSQKTSQNKNSHPVTPVTPGHTTTSEDKASNPSKAGSKPEEPIQGDSGVS
jgi:hypothetical protein